MPRKTKQALSPIEELQRLAELPTRRAADVREAVDEYNTEVIEKLNEAHLESVDIEELSVQTGALRDAAEQLLELGLADQEMLDELDTTAGWFGLLAERIPKEGIDSVLEAYDELVRALDSFEDLKDQDSYPGKKDDMESAWDEVTTAIADLATAHEDLGIVIGETDADKESDG